MKRIIFLFFVFLLSGSGMLQAQDKSYKAGDKKLTIDKIEKQLNDTIFKVSVQWAYPMRGKSISLNSLYSLTVKGKTVNSYLPYYGRGYSIPYGGGKALDFEGVLSDYKVSFLKKKMRVKFTVTNEEDTYIYSLDIFSNGNTLIGVTPQKRDPINFQGQLTVE